MLIVDVKKLREDAIVPEFAHSTDSGFDVFSCEETFIAAHKKGLVKTGIALGLPKGWGVVIRNKSGVTLYGVPIKTTIDIEDGRKADVTIFIGTIDTNYRGEIGIMIKNEEDFDITIPKHIKLAQGVLERVYQCHFNVVNDLEETDRGEGGFGSTGLTQKGA